MYKVSGPKCCTLALWYAGTGVFQNRSLRFQEHHSTCLPSWASSFQVLAGSNFQVLRSKATGYRPEACQQGTWSSRPGRCLCSPTPSPSTPGAQRTKGSFKRGFYASFFIHSFFFFVFFFRRVQTWPYDRDSARRQWPNNAAFICRSNALSWMAHWTRSRYLNQPRPQTGSKFGSVQPSSSSAISYTTTSSRRLAQSEPSNEDVHGERAASVQRYLVGLAFGRL